MTFHCRMNRILATTLLAALPVMSACDSESLMPPEAVDGMFARYVSIGNSITAGFQSGGVTEAMQLQSYAALMAAQMGLSVGGHSSEFNVPLLNDPGCPPPYTDIFTQTRVGGLTGGDCYVRKAPIPTSLNNVAVPGSAVIDALTNLDDDSGPNALTTLFLGGRTQLEVAAAVDPTFVTVWMGNNDVLGALLTTQNAGNPALVTAPATFASRYSDLMDALDGMGSIEGGVLIGVVQVTAAPYASVGGAYFVAAQQIPTLTVDANCLATAPIPGTTESVSVLVPFHYGAVLMGMAAAGVPTTLDCSVDDVISTTEALNMVSSVAQYNAAIEAEADERGWVFVDPNDLLVQLAADPAAIRPFPAFGSADPADIAAPFGTALSIDGVHPSASVHVLVANALIAAINAHYSTSIPAIN